MTPSPSLPSRYRDRSTFDRFAVVIGRCLAQYPRPVALTGKPSAVMQPLRYALRGKALYGWKSPLVDDALWKAHAPFLRVFEHDGKAWLGVPPTGEVKTIEVADERVAYELTDLSLLPEVCRLVGTNALRPMPTIVVREDKALARLALSSTFQVSFVPVDGDPSLYQII